AISSSSTMLLTDVGFAIPSPYLPHPRRRIAAPGMAFGQLHIASADPAGVLHLVIGDRPHYLARHPHHHGARRDAPSLTDDCSGRDEAFLPNVAAGEQDGAHADKAVLANMAAVQEGSMAHDYTVLNHQRLVGIGVQHAAVLNVGA